MDEEFGSFVVTDPDLVDPSIDVSGLRTQTDTSLLGNIPDFAGIQYEAFNPTRLTDLMRLYTTGLPAIDTAQIPGAVDTLVDVGGGGGMDQVTGGSMLDAPTDSGLTESGTFAGQPTFTTTPGTTVDNVTGDITNPDGSYGGNIVDEVALTGGTITPVDTSIAIEDLTQPSNVGDFQITAASPLTNQTQITDPVTPIQDLPMVTTSINRATGEVFDAQTGEEIGNLYDEVALTGTGTPEQQEGFLQNVLGRAGQTVEGALNELGKIPGAVVDFTKKTVDIFGQKLDVGKTLASAVLNKIAGGPVSLIFDLLPEESLENTTTRNIVDELKAEKDYGFNIQSGNLNQDPFGRNPVSAFGDYEQTLLDDIAGVNQSGFQTAEMREKKKEFAQDYFNKKAEKAGGAEVDEGVVLGPGEAPGDLISLEELQAEKDAEIAAQNELAKLTGDVDTFDTTPADTTNIVDEVALTGGGDRDRDPDSTPSAPVSTAGQAGPPSQRGGGADIPDRGRGTVSTAGQAGPPSQRGGEGGDGGGGGGGKSIVCTAMYQTTGLEDWSKAMKIWYIYQKKYLTIEHQEGYHKLFKPFVKGMHKSSIIKAIGAHVARHRTQHLKHVMFNSKPSLLGKIYNKILEPICYWVGRHG